VLDLATCLCNELKTFLKITHNLSKTDKICVKSHMPPGVPGSVWLAEWEQVKLAPAVADEMERVIEEQCERIDPDDWQ
jgi:hypothetical protein